MSLSIKDNLLAEPVATPKIGSTTVSQPEPDVQIPPVGRIVEPTVPMHRQAPLVPASGSIAEKHPPASPFLEPAKTAPVDATVQCPPELPTTPELPGVLPEKVEPSLESILPREDDFDGGWQVVVPKTKHRKARETSASPQTNPGSATPPKAVTAGAASCPTITSPTRTRPVLAPRHNIGVSVEFHHKVAPESLPPQPKQWWDSGRKWASLSPSDQSDVLHAIGSPKEFDMAFPGWKNWTPPSVMRDKT